MFAQTGFRGQHAHKSLDSELAWHGSFQRHPRALSMPFVSSSNGRRRETFVFVALYGDLGFMPRLGASSHISAHLDHPIAIALLTVESQEPVHRLMASLLTPKQLTRFSWPCKEPTRSPRRTSHTCKCTCQPSNHLRSCGTRQLYRPCIRNRRIQRRAVCRRLRKQQT